MCVAMKKPCLHFLRGACRFGSSCRFDHDLSSVLSGPLPIKQRERSQLDSPASGNSMAFKIMSYNILADFLAWDHVNELYSSMPRHALEWRYRRKLLLKEICHHMPHILCLQEVDRNKDIEKRLGKLGYTGSWCKRTGDRRDRLATFWREDTFQVSKSECIEFAQLGLRDNVSQLTLLQSISQKDLHILVANIHVLFNPKRGDIKLAQVRTLLEAVKAMQGHEKLFPPAIICGDFNSSAGSAIHQFVVSGELNVAEFDRHSLSGQISGGRLSGRGWTLLRERFLSNNHGMKPSTTHVSEQMRKVREWSAEELCVAVGDSCDTSSAIARHPLKLASAYHRVCGSEPAWTTCHDGYIGTVDFIFFTEDHCGGLFLQPHAVLQPPPLESLRTGLPSVEWPSDH